MIFLTVNGSNCLKNNVLETTGYTFGKGLHKYSYLKGDNQKRSSSCHYSLHIFGYMIHCELPSLGFGKTNFHRDFLMLMPRRNQTHYCTTLRKIVQASFLKDTEFKLHSAKLSIIDYLFFTNSTSLFRSSLCHLRNNSQNSCYNSNSSLKDFPKFYEKDFSFLLQFAERVLFFRCLRESSGLPRTLTRELLSSNSRQFAYR